MAPFQGLTRPLRHDAQGVALGYRVEALRASRGQRLSAHAAEEYNSDGEAALRGLLWSIRRDSLKEVAQVNARTLIVGLSAVLATVPPPSAAWSAGSHSSREPLSSRFRPMAGSLGWRIRRRVVYWRFCRGSKTMLQFHQLMGDYRFSA